MPPVHYDRWPGLASVGLTLPHWGSQLGRDREHWRSLLGDSADKTLAVPLLEPVTFNTNFIKTVVCELRFPTILEIDQHRLASLHEPLRKTYPIYDRQQTLTLPSADEELQRQVAHLFYSKDKAWALVVKNAAIGLETGQYTTFHDFEARLKQVLKAAVPFVDSDFFTRVGLRYVNAISLGKNDLTHYINKDLVAPLAAGVYGRVVKFVQEVRGFTGAGLFTLRHGYGEPAPGFREEAPAEAPAYTIDLDFYAENVPIESVIQLVTGFRKISFSLFMWCLGPGMRDELMSTVKP